VSVVYSNRLCSAVHKKHYVSRAGNKEICTLLLNAGAEVDAKTPELGTTPLMRAVHQNHLVVARLLVSYGASIDETNSDQENVFHILATAVKNAAAKSDPSQNDNKESHVELARWLRNKASSQQEGKLDRMLTARDIHGRIPVECLGEDTVQEFSDIVAILSPS
jgi:hypothetical protein